MTEFDKTSGTRALLVELGREESGVPITLETIIERFRQRAHGLLLLLVLLPVFIPLPLGTGGVAGALACLIGGQLLYGRSQPWLPRRILQRQIKPSTLAGFSQRLQGLLGWLERVCKPRYPALVDGRIGRIITGLELIGLGILLALPIPLTNYFYALLLLLHAIALIERDGGLLLASWILGIAAMLASVLLSGQGISLLQNWLG